MIGFIVKYNAVFHMYMSFDWNLLCCIWFHTDITIVRLFILCFLSKELTEKVADSSAEGRAGEVVQHWVQDAVEIGQTNQIVKC